jgi:hypothetical protein
MGRLRAVAEARPVAEAATKKWRETMVTDD